MKERFEGLSAWKEKQKEEKNFLEGKLEEAKDHVITLTCQNEELKSRLQILEKTEGGAAQVRLSSHILHSVVLGLSTISCIYCVYSGQPMQHSQHYNSVWTLEQALC